MSILSGNTLETTSSSPFTKPEISLVSNPETGITKLHIDHLSPPDPKCRLNDPNSCMISRIVHQYKRLISDGDRLGSKHFKYKLPLENSYFHANVSHSILYNSQHQRLEISFVQCYTSDIHIRVSTRAHRIPGPEITKFITKFCTMCAQELEIYFDAVYLDGIYSHRPMDFYGFQPIT